MARTSERLSSSAKATPAYHKRAASAAALSTAVEVKRPRTKSQYFESQDLSDQGIGDEDDELSSADDSASDFNDLAEGGAGSQSEDEDDRSEDEPTSRTTTGKATSSTGVPRIKGEELWRPGVKAGMGPGTQVVIKKPKARPAGQTPYSDETIHPNTMDFLRDLKANNDRQWLKSKSCPVIFY